MEIQGYTGIWRCLMLELRLILRDYPDSTKLVPQPSSCCEFWLPMS